MYFKLVMSMDASQKLPASVIQTITNTCETIKRQESQSSNLNVTPPPKHCIDQNASDIDTNS